MKIDIWSDVMCPFCYIGKRHMEAALAGFEHAGSVEKVWHSFQLDPDMKSQPGKDIYSYLAERKGQTREWSVKMHEQVVNAAKQAGLTYNFDKAVIANSFDAHRLVQLAKKHGLGDAAEESLFKAYFTDGRDIADHNVLMQLAMDMGLRAVEVGEMLNSDEYATDVINDVVVAQELGIRGVPFFVVNDKYAISGAQPVEAFTQTLDHAWAEYEQAKMAVSIDEAMEGGVCTPDGVCTPEKKK